MASKQLRCAIYTRKSTEHGLELEFNSLDAQREACAAYIKSQASQGWNCLPQHYDDAAFSGGNLDRPALKQLLADIDGGKVDVVVVYKIDRLTRSLADFAKLVEAFEARKVSFVAVTQQFNTTSSMGRLTLNVLLSFAQFERELAAERVRDKIAASRAKGKWMGGTVPLGYDVKDKKLVPHPTEAGQVRHIFKRYIELGNLQALIDDLDHRQIVTKRRIVKNAKYQGGIRFSASTLANLLKNRTYIGQAGHKGKWYDAEHKAIVDPKTFERAQELLQTNSVRRSSRRSENGALLMGKLFDNRGNRMSPSYSKKNGVRYHFYVSAALLRGRKKDAGSLTRVSAGAIEAAVVRGIRDYVSGATDLPDAEVIERHLRRAEVSATELRITVVVDGIDQTITLPWQVDSTDIKINGAEHEPDAKLVETLVRAHAWARMLEDGTYLSIEDLAAAVKLHPKIVRQSIRTAFLAPEITESILLGGHPPDLPRRLRGNVPLSWEQQRAVMRAQ